MVAGSESARWCSPQLGRDSDTFGWGRGCGLATLDSLTYHEPSAHKMPSSATCQRPSQPLVQLSKLVLKGMRARRRGVVINVGSGVSTVIPASPLLSGVCLVLYCSFV